MKRVLFFSCLLVTMLFCGTVLANDITGEYGYHREYSDGSEYGIFITIEKRGENNYYVNGLQQSISGVNHVRKFVGTGNSINGIVVVNGKIMDGFDEVRTENATLRIYSKPHPDLVKYGDEQINEAKKSNDKEMKKYYIDRGNKFKNLKESQIAILSSDYDFVDDVCPKK